MYALVTGAAGFIGSHLCERLLKDGHKVMGIDDFSNGRQENISSFYLHPRFTIVNHPVDRIYLDKKIDTVFHLAALADIVPSIQNPLGYHQANVTTTIALLEECRKLKHLNKFVYAASSSCYGIPDDFPTDEKADIRCEYPYALTKHLGEQYVLHYSKVYKVPSISLRLFNVYGPRHRTSGSYGAMFGVFMSQLANHKPLTVVGDGEQKRDFTYVTDVCDAFVRAGESPFERLIFNIGSGGCYTVNQVADLLGSSPANRLYLPKRPGEPGITFANIDKAKSLLGYQPKVSIEEGCAVMKKLIPKYKDAPLWTVDTIKQQTKEWFQYLS